MVIRLALILAAVCFASPARAMDRVRVGASGHSFVLSKSNRPFVPWGFNYDRDFKFRLIEEYWDNDWRTVEEDFKEMKAMGANVVRVHLQVPKFMTGPGRFNGESFRRLSKLINLAEELGIYLDVTGLGCYRKGDVPAWYDALAERDRWWQQSVFWEEVALTCANSPAIFCYDLMNEPIVPAQKVDSWLVPHELAGFSYMQHIVKEPVVRDRAGLGRAWVNLMVRAIRRQDPNAMITVGLPPLGGVGFEPKDMAQELDFLSVHVYPTSGKLEESMDVIRRFWITKPVVIEETFPLNCSAEELGRFIEQSKSVVAGWMGFYWGRTPDELRQRDEVSDKVALAWLELFQKLRP